MSWTDFLARIKQYERNAAVIFDEEEPIGQPTDLVLPNKRWFRRAKKAQPFRLSRMISNAKE